MFRKTQVGLSKKVCMYLFFKGLLSPKIKVQNLRLLLTTSATHYLPIYIFFHVQKLLGYLGTPVHVYKIICYAKIVDIKMRALISKRAGLHLWVYIYVGTYLLATPITYYNYDMVLDSSLSLL